MKKTFIIPVSWEVYSTISVEANSLDEALAYLNENIDEIPLCQENEYVDGSYRIDEVLACEDGACDAPYGIGSVIIDVPDDFIEKY